MPCFYGTFVRIESGWLWELDDGDIRSEQRGGGGRGSGEGFFSFSRAGLLNGWCRWDLRSINVD